MDAFLSAAQRRLRQTVRDFFRESVAAEALDPGSGPTSGPIRVKLLERLEGLGFLGLSDRRGDPPAAGAAPDGLDAALCLEEIAAGSPALALSFLPASATLPAESGASLPGGSFGSIPAAGSAEAAWLIGTSAFILEACYKAARERGLFASTLMAFSDGQQALANALVRLEACRLQVCRGWLAGGVDPGRGSAELTQALTDARALAADVRALGAAHLGEEWCRVHIPPGPPGHERNVT